MKKRFFLLAVMLICFLGASAQGLRHSVCVVYPEFTSAERQVMADYSVYLARLDFRSEARALTAYKSEDGTFGSGVVVEFNGKKYVITNRHVVAYASTAKIIFQLNKENIKFEKCPVVAVSQYLDLAAIELPAESEQIPLTVNLQPIEEGQNISAAGFPALGNKPSWQLSRGTISNASLTHEDLGENTYIQHTAPIDPGSSGGPLLMKVDDRYQIVGINTYKAFAREGVGITIPSADVEEFIQSLSSPENIYRTQLDEVAQMDARSWSYLYNNLPKDDIKSLNEFKSEMPLDVVIRSLEIRDEIIAQANIEDKNGKKDRNAVKAAKQLKTNSKNRIDTDYDTTHGLILDYNYFTPDNMGVALSFMTAWNGYLITGFRINFGIVKYKLKDASTPAPSAGIMLGGQIPFIVSKDMYLIPRITQSADAGIIIKGDDIVVNADTRVMLFYEYRGGNVGIQIGLGYDFQFKYTGASLPHLKYKPDQYLYHGLATTIGITF